MCDIRMLLIPALFINYYVNNRLRSYLMIMIIVAASFPGLSSALIHQTRVTWLQSQVIIHGMGMRLCICGLLVGVNLIGHAFPGSVVCFFPGIIVSYLIIT